MNYKYRSSKLLNNIPSWKRFVLNLLLFNGGAFLFAFFKVFDIMSSNLIYFRPLHYNNLLLYLVSSVGYCLINIFDKKSQVRTISFDTENKRVVVDYRFLLLFDKTINIAFDNLKIEKNKVRIKVILKSNNRSFVVFKNTNGWKDYVLDEIYLRYKELVLTPSSA